MNDKLPTEILIELFSYLHGGMVLRCGAVCKSWKEAADDDYLWIIILGREFEKDKRLSLDVNITMDRKVAQKWREMYNMPLKLVYLTMRRQQKKDPAVSRIFPSIKSPAESPTKNVTKK
jgi:hypothetical protein